MKRITDRCHAERELLLRDLAQLRSRSEIPGALSGAVFQKERELAAVDALIAKREALLAKRLSQSGDHLALPTPSRHGL